MATNQNDTQHLDDDTVLIAGGGPVGLIVATVLAHYGTKSVVLERNSSTTKSANHCCPNGTITDKRVDGPRWT